MITALDLLVEDLFCKCDFYLSILTLLAPPFYLEFMKACQDMENCRDFEKEAVNPMTINHREILRIEDKVGFFIRIYLMPAIVD